MRALVALLLTVSICSAADVTLQEIVVKEHGLTATVAVVPKGSNRGFAVIDVPKRKPKETVLRYWDAEKHEFIINGGFFYHDFSPVGYCRVGGRELNSKHSRVFSGYVAIDKNGALHLKSRGEKLEGFPTVIQSGPYVIDPGGRKGIKSKKNKIASRTLIGRMQDGRVFVMVTNAISLYDLCLAVKKKMPRVERLLNLDGGTSSAFKHSKKEILNLLPVRNYIVKEKQ